MPIFESGNLRIDLDEKGYLVREQDWTREVAVALAQADELGPLTADHWRIIDFLRGFQAARGAAPMIRVLCKETGFSLQKIYDLFPEGPAKGACRIAGLPRPDSCV